jgi:hemerythrin-like domain-containing protein
MADNSNDGCTIEDFTEFEDGVASYSRRGPVRKKPASNASLKGILEVLYSEHRYICSLLDTLELQAQRLDKGKIPDYHLLYDIVDYLTHYPGQYHHPREDLLFDGMLESDSSFEPSLERLLREHATLDHYNHELLNELTLIADGRPADRAGLKRRIVRYLAGYREHIEYESQEIFPKAKGILSTADLKKLDAKTRYVDDPMFGGEVQYQYQRVRRSVNSRLENAGSRLVAAEMAGIESVIGNLTRWVATLDGLKSTLAEQGREAWQEQLDTMKDHSRPGERRKLVLLPLALASNHRRHLVEGFGEIRSVLKRAGKGEG